MTTKRLIPILEARAIKLGCSSAVFILRKGRRTVTRKLRSGDEVIVKLNSK